MLIEPSVEVASSILPPVYRVEVLSGTTAEDSELLGNLAALQQPLGSIPGQSVSLASLLENSRMTSEGHF